jgi:hypothetical protein
MGSTFERDVTELPPTAADQQAAHASNGEKLAALLPGAGRRCAPSSMLSSDPPPGRACVARPMTVCRWQAPPGSRQPIYRACGC